MEGISRSTLGVRRRKPVQSLMDAGLWKSPVATLRNFQWQENEWIIVQIEKPPQDVYRRAYPFLKDMDKSTTLGN